MNIKAVERLYREERLALCRRKGKKIPKGVREGAWCPIAADQRWSLDSTMDMQVYWVTEREIPISVTSGDITRARGLSIGHLEQNVPDALLKMTMYDAVLDALPVELAETESWRVDIVLDDLKVPIEHHQKPLAALSGGWQRIALLARIWVREPDLLLMDEPTNHLDLSRTGILQDWLKTVARGVPIIVASHDRAFLDDVTNRTLFLRETRSQVFALPYPRGIVDDWQDTMDKRADVQLLVD